MVARDGTGAQRSSPAIFAGNLTAARSAKGGSRESGFEVAKGGVGRMVARDGIEPPTRGFSIPCSTN